MVTVNWEHPSPIFLDFETQSACDIKESGGRAYVEHPSTRILILVLSCDDVFHVWIPDYIRTDSSTWNADFLWPNQLKPKHTVCLYRGNELPEPIRECVFADPARPLVAHNAYGFDKAVWNRFLPQFDNWLDSIPLARQAGRDGRLDVLGKRILGVGKDHAKKLLPKLTTATPSRFGAGFSYPVINAGDLQAFTRYAVADVEILKRLWSEFDSIKVEADVIQIHNQINERGIGVDVELLESIERLSEYSVTQAIVEIKKRTNGALHEDNIRSGKQVAEWLDKFGVQITDDSGKPCLRKEIVQKFIDSPYVLEDNLTSVTEIPPVCIDVMRLRMKALRITDAKVKKARNRVSSDNRIRDLLTYHKAHTGRWSSSGVQVHNLPRPNNAIAAQVEHLLREANCVPFVPRIEHSNKDVRILFDSIKAHIPSHSTATVDDICSALIRPAFCAKPDHTFAIVDFSQVEARGTAWLADEKKMLTAFAEGRDLYKEFAARVFHVTLADVTKDMRQIAKSAVLGCVAEDTLVPTDKGFKKIQDIKIDDMVWDGVEYVRHAGVIYKGERECLHHQSIPNLTSDHLVLSIKGWQEASDVITGNMKLHPAKRLTDGRLLLKGKYRKKEKRGYTISVDVVAAKQKKWREATLYLEKLRVADSVTTSEKKEPNTPQWCQTSNTANDCLTESVRYSHGVTTKRVSNTGTTEVEVLRFLLSGLKTVLHSLPISSPFRVGITHDLKLIESKITKVTNRATSDSPHEKNSVATPVEVKRTYDILNCGPRQQFQAGNAIVHNCQYGLGYDKFRVYAAVNGCDLAGAGVTSEQVINAYRDEYTKIAGWKPKASDSFRVGGIWKDYDKAVKECVSTGIPQFAGKCRFLIESNDLVIILPSGRELHYPNARIEDIVPPYCYTLNLPLNPKATVVYDSDRGQKSLYGGLITENVTQAMCRDIMACAMLKLEAEGFPVVAHVHDEILIEVHKSKAKHSIERMVAIMSEVPDWATGFPLECEGFTCDRFNKSHFSYGFECSTRKPRAVDIFEKAEEIARQNHLRSVYR